MTSNQEVQKGTHLKKQCLFKIVEKIGALAKAVVSTSDVDWKKVISLAVETQSIGKFESRSCLSQ